MTQGTIHTNEEAAVAAFAQQAPIFDNQYANDTIIQYKRERVRAHLERFLPPGASILELNAGTGDDAIYFASQGHQVHATDAAAPMQHELVSKVKNAGLEKVITTELISFTQLENLQQQGPYDVVFSNFAGLNCTDRLDRVLDSLPFLVKGGGYVTLVILPKFSLWEFLLLFRGKFKTAFRRFSGPGGTKAHLEGKHFRCWYYNPSFIRNQLAGSFKQISLEGLCTIVPPSYMHGFAEKNPRLYEFLIRKESRMKSWWPWRSIGDYYIITLKRNS